MTSMLMDKHRKGRHTGKCYNTRLCHLFRRCNYEVRVKEGMKTIIGNVIYLNTAMMALERRMALSVAISLMVFAMKDVMKDVFHLTLAMIYEQQVI